MAHCQPCLNLFYYSPSLSNYLSSSPSSPSFLCLHYLISPHALPLHLVIFTSFLPWPIFSTVRLVDLILLSLVGDPPFPLLLFICHSKRLCYGYGMRFDQILTSNLISDFKGHFIRMWCIYFSRSPLLALLEANRADCKMTHCSWIIHRRWLNFMTARLIVSFLFLLWSCSCVSTREARPDKASAHLTSEWNLWISVINLANVKTRLTFCVWYRFHVLLYSTFLVLFLLRTVRVRRSTPHSCAHINCFMSLTACCCSR